MHIKDEKFVTWSEARKILEKKTDEIGELGYEQKNALEHLKRFSKTSGKRITEMIDALSKIERLKERHIMIIVNILPQTTDELKILFSNEMIELGDDEMKKIINIVKKHS